MEKEVWKKRFRKKGLEKGLESLEKEFGKGGLEKKAPTSVDKTLLVGYEASKVGTQHFRVYLHAHTRTQTHTHTHARTHIHTHIHK